MDMARCPGLDTRRRTRPATCRAWLGAALRARCRGALLVLGSLRWMDELAVPLGAAGGRGANAAQASGATVSVLASQAATGVWSPLALLAFGDEAKPGAREALARLRAQGLRLFMVSGDNRSAAEAMARTLGLHPGSPENGGEVIAEVLPGDKAAVIARFEGRAWARGFHRRAAPR